MAYSPSTDAGVVLWLDASDTSLASIQAVGGIAVTNGATVSLWSSKKGSVRGFTQHGTNGRPTFESAGINGLGTCKFTTNQILTTTLLLPEYGAMAGLTAMGVVKRVSGNGVFFSTTMVDQATGNSDITQCQLNLGPNYTGGGRQARGDTFVTVGPGSLTPAIFVETIAFGFGSGHISVYGNGFPEVVNQAYHTPGTTNAGDPSRMSVGGTAQATSLAAFAFAEGSVGEVIVWLSEMNATQLAPAHDYLLTKWGLKTLDPGGGGSGTYRPIMNVTERSELLRASLTPDSMAGLSKADEFTAKLVRFNSSGSLATVQTIASIGATAGDWTPFRAKPMKLVSGSVILEQGDTLAIGGDNQTFTGVLSLRLRRVL